MSKIRVGREAERPERYSTAPLTIFTRPAGGIGIIFWFSFMRSDRFLEILGPVLQKASFTPRHSTSTR